MDLKKILASVSAAAIAASMLGSISAFATSYTPALASRTWDFKCTGDSEQIPMIRVSDNEEVTVSRKNGNSDNSYSGEYNYNGAIIYFESNSYNRPNTAGVNLYSGGSSGNTAKNYIKYTAPCAGTLTVTVTKNSKSKFQIARNVSTFADAINNCSSHSDIDENSNYTSKNVDISLAENETIYMLNKGNYNNNVTIVEGMTFTPATQDVNYTFGGTGNTLNINATYGTQTETFTHTIDTTITGNVAVTFDDLPVWVTVNSVTLN